MLSFRSLFQNHAYIPQPATPFVIPPRPVKALRFGRGGEIDVPYIRCLDGWVPESFELWAFAEDEIREIHTSARIKLIDDFVGDNFNTHFFNVRTFQIPFLGRRSVNMSVEFFDAARATQQFRSCVTSWTENIFFHSWGPYPTMIHHTVSNITRRACDVTVTPHALVLRANHERLRLKRVEWRKTCHRELLARICQDMRDEVRAVLSNDSDDIWLEGSNSD